jgi:hypothetical protein
MGVNLLNEMLEIESKSNEILEEANQIIQSDLNDLNRLKEEMSGQIFSDEAVKKICLKYRMRFLDVKWFKGEIPIEATEEIMDIESRYKTRLRRLKIIAPGRFFELDFRDKDPMLFAEVEKGKYLFIHKWGRDMNPLRKIASWPLRTAKNLFVSLVVLAMVLCLGILLLTGGWGTTPLLHLAFGLFVVTGGLCMFTLFLCLAFNIYPTEMNWNSRFLDA